MNIEYKMTEYFKDNNLLNEKTTNGLTVQKDNDNGAHIHLDEKTLLDDNSQYKNVIIEKI